MKKHVLILLMVFISSHTFAQKIIENPAHGYSTVPGKIIKIELLDSVTVFHFHIKYKPKYWINIPKETFIKNINSGEKLFMTQAEGIPVDERYFMPNSGEVKFKLYFPKIDNNLVKIDFGEANDKLGWGVYNIILNESKVDFKLPKTLIGNWLRIDGSNQCDYGLLFDKAVVDSKIWNYQSVKAKKDVYTIVLEKDGQEKTIYAKINKNKQVAIGENKTDLKIYSTARTNNPNYQLKNDEPYLLPIFKNDSATYSGMVSGYTPRIGRSTTMLYVNNTFTGNQESHLIKIEDNGSFSIKIPIAYPQFVLVRGLSVNMSVFIEPGKEIFHFIVPGKDLFMGDGAQVNTDLVAMKSINYFNYQNAYKDILTIDSQDFKEPIVDIQNREMNAVNKLVKTKFISQKALQLKKLDIEISALTNILSYDLQKSSALRRQENEENTLPVNETKLDVSYYNVLTKAVLDNELAVMASRYSSFINRLMFADIFRDNSGVRVTSRTTAQFAEGLQKQSVELTKDELEMIEYSKEIQTEDFRKRQSVFYDKYGEKFSEFLKQHHEIFNEIEKDKEKSLDLLVSLKSEGIILNLETENMLQDFNALNTPEEKEKQILFNETYGDDLKAFYENHKNVIGDINAQDYYNSTLRSMQGILGEEEAFVFDIVRLQQNLSALDRNMVPYSDTKVNWLQKPIKTSFLSNYIRVENDKLKAKIEANKTKEGYTVNEVEKTEGNELFESIITPFKGKVVYVDFWATWCGPCKSGIKRIKPLKEELKEEDVVFLYITGPSSPEATWKNSIPDIKGEHYRVSKDEWNYLTDKFKITGIPHYALVSKDGKVVNDKLGHKTNDELKTILKEEMNNIQ